MKLHTRAVFVVFMVVVLTAVQGAQAMTVFTSRALWTAATTGALSTEDFESIAIQTLTAGTTTLGSLDFTIDVTDTWPFPPTFNRIDSPNPVNGSRGFTGRVSNDGTNNGGSFGQDIATFINVDFGQSVTAFGADFHSTTTGAELQVKLMINGTPILFSDHLAGAGTGFLGVIDATPFSSVTFEAVDPAGGAALAEVFSMDDVTTAVVPEPTSLLLLGGSLAGYAFARRRRRKRG